MHANSASARKPAVAGRVQPDAGTDGGADGSAAGPGKDASSEPLRPPGPAAGARRHTISV